MRGLDDILTPSTDRPALWLDAAAMAPLGIILAVLLPGWVQTGETYLTDVSGQMSSPLMLLAMGMALAFRVGSIDLSGWMIAAASGLAAAALIGQGVSAVVAFVLAAGLGAAVGAINGLLVAAIRLPSLLVTAVMAGGIFGAVSLLPVSEITVPDGAFTRWLVLLPAPEEVDAIPESLPLGVTRMAIVLCVFTLVMGVLVAAKRWRLEMSKRRWAALAASGALAGLAGACGLLDHGRAVVPSLPVDDLRPIAAALLTGALVLAGPGRTPVVGLVVPIAMLASTIWWQAVPLGAAGVEWQLVILIGIGIATTVAARTIRRRTTADRPAYR